MVFLLLIYNKKKQTYIMNLYYKYNNEIIKMKNSDFVSIENYSVKKMDNALKTSITRKFKLRIEEYIKLEYTIEIKKCAFCDEYSDFKIVYELTPYKKSYMVNIADVIYDKLYCKSKNKNCDGRNLNANSVEFVSKAYSLSKDEALKIKNSRNSSPFYECNYENKEDYRKYQSIRDRFKDNDRYNTFIKNLKYSKTIDYYIEKHGKDNGEKIWYDIQSKKDSMSFKYFLNKNNNDYNKTLLEYNNRIKSVCGNKCIGGFYSKESITLFDKFINELKIEKTNIIYGENEYFLSYFDYELNKYRKFYYDFVDIKNKIIVEYNGLKWHPNKNKMTKEQYNKWVHPFQKDIKLEDLEKKDILKIKIAEEHGFNVIIIWDCDEKINKNYNLNILLEYYKKNKLI